jgi:di/tricarboxylate transporter
VSNRPKRHSTEPSVTASFIASGVLAALAAAAVVFGVIPLIIAQAHAPATVTEYYVHGPSQQVPSYGVWALVFGIFAAFLLLLAFLAFRTATKTARKRAKQCGE